MASNKSSLIKVLLIAGCAAVLAACGSSGKSASNRDASLAYFKNGAAQATTVNRYLWSASLETLDFLPIQSADPISGLILTDWHQNPETPNERFKLNVYILDSALRADALRVSVFRQERSIDGAWQDASTNPATSREIENAILTRARQLRLNQIEG